MNSKLRLPTRLSLVVSVVALGIAGTTCELGCRSRPTVAINCGSTPCVGRLLSADKVAVVTSKFELQVWDISNPETPVVRLQVPDRVSQWHVLPLSRELVACPSRISTERGVKIIDISTGKTKILFPLMKPDREVSALACSPSGRLLAWVECGPGTGKPEKEVLLRVGNTDSGKITLEVVVPLLDPECQKIDSLAVSPDERTIAFGASGEPAAGAVDLVSAKVLWHMERRGGVWRVAYNKEGDSFFCTDSCGGLTRYDVRTGKVLFQSVVTLPGYTAWGEQAADRLLAVDVSPDGKYVATGTDFTHQVIIWDASTGERLRSIDASAYPIESVLFFSWDGKGIWTSGTRDKELWFFPLD